MDSCGQRCLCKNGQPVECTRIRREFVSMTTEQRKKYISTMLLGRNDRRFKADYDKLITVHKTVFTSGIHQRDLFLPWHRWFLLQYENHMRRVDCSFTVAYWDWAEPSGRAWRALARDVWFNGASGFGGNGSASDNCVRAGPFRGGAWKLVPSAGRGCLKRKFKGSPPHRAAVAKLLKFPAADFIDFELGLRVNFHDTIHCLLGGTMCSLDSANAPEFFLHHSRVDQIWADWQRRSSAHRNAHFSGVSQNMPSANLPAAVVLDVSRLPGNVRVEYEVIQGSDSRLADEIQLSGILFIKLSFSLSLSSLLLLLLLVVVVVVVVW